MGFENGRTLCRGQNPQDKTRGRPILQGQMIETIELCAVLL